jgi:hypothetical protein
MPFVVKAWTISANRQQLIKHREAFDLRQFPGAFIEAEEMIAPEQPR